MKGASVELRGVSKKYGDLVAVHPLHLVLQPNQTTAVIGPSGCGKSTLLRIIMGLIAPDSGEVLIGDQPVTNWLSQRRSMGYVIQDGGLFPHLTARANIELASKHFGRSKPERDQRIAELAELTSFPTEGLERYPNELSGGQRQRVGLMRALMLDPQILLLDEPLGALDPMVRARLQSDLKAIFDRLKKTVILVTHDLAEAAYLGDTIVLMNEGRVVQAGSLAVLQTAPETPFVTEFINAQRTLVTL
jgi:osmoprotectant transport system ATP-binding protein